MYIKWVSVLSLLFTSFTSCQATSFSDFLHGVYKPTASSAGALTPNARGHQRVLPEKSKLKHQLGSFCVVCIVVGDVDHHGDINNLGVGHETFALLCKMAMFNQHHWQ